ncbi:hypothetical protein [Metallosphaera hakonensis]|nr:hypothetical protein [Metallosphaera hakonensis]
METAVIVVIGADKPGIVAGISSKLAEKKREYSRHLPNGIEGNLLHDNDS